MFKDLIILIPAYNEQKNLLKVIKKFKKFSEIIVVNDYSNDKTYSIAKNNSDYIINNKKRYGYDKTLRIGINFIIKNLNKKYILTVDADDQHQDKFVKNFLQAIKRNDVVIGKRNIFNRKIEKKISDESFAKFKILDPLSGMKCYKIESIKNYFKKLNKNSDYLGMFFFEWIFDLKISNININVNKKNKFSSMGNGKLLEEKFYNIFKKLTS
jgi:glycosyltransferase involved in cell wall biosynthesis